MDGWRDEIENYWVTEGPNGDGYGLFYVPTCAQVIVEEESEERILISEMITAGVRIVPFDEFKRYVRSQMAPEWQPYYEELTRKEEEEQKRRDAEAKDGREAI